MQSNDVRDELADGIEAAPLPPIGPDGGPQLTPARKIDLGPPRLCEFGPCRNYHRLEVQVDAQNPLRERRSDGTVLEHGRVFHTAVHHYCYPDVGIETVLGSEAVVSCNRWVPVRRLFRTKGSVARAHAAAVTTWEQAREQEMAEIAAVAMAAVAPIDLVIRFEGRGLHGDGRLMSEPADTDLETIVQLAAGKDGIVVSRDIDDVTVKIAGDVVTNLSATPGQLELTPGTEVIVCISPRKDSAE